MISGRKHSIDITITQGKARARNWCTSWKQLTERAWWRKKL